MTGNKKLTAVELLPLLKQKNEKAFNYLYDEYASLIYGVILREVQNEILAQEILKSAFANIIKECRNIDCITQSIFTWLLLLTKKTAEANYKVKINLLSLLPAVKAKGANDLHTHTRFQDGYLSTTSCIALDKTA